MGTARNREGEGRGGEGGVRREGSGYLVASKDLEFYCEGNMEPSLGVGQAGTWCD